MAVDCLIFSKDRPAQLELLLRSIRLHAPDLYSSVTVLWRTESTLHERGYYKLIDGNRETCSWVRESNGSFERHVREWLIADGEWSISFLCDDDVFHRDLAGHPVPPGSLRRGDFDYPFSLDGNLYHRADIISLLDGLPFRNPTELEWFGYEYRSRLPFRTVIPWPDCLVGGAVNRVVEIGGDMPSAGIDPNEVTRWFLMGRRLAIPSPPPEGFGTHTLQEPVWE